MNSLIGLIILVVVMFVMPYYQEKRRREQEEQKRQADAQKGKENNDGSRDHESGQQTWNAAWSFAEGRHGAGSEKKKGRGNKKHSDERFPGLRREFPRITGVDWKRFILAMVITAALSAVIYYFALPAMNPKSVGFWFYLICVVFILDISYRIVAARAVYRNNAGGPGAVRSMAHGTNERLVFILRVAMGLLIVVPIVIAIFGSAPFFHARAYSRILTVEDGSVDDIPSVEGTDSIALMDTESAQKLGNREIGSLSNVISQYDVSDYTQINYQDRPVKTSPLRYAGFFKWINNHKKGVPGYIIVDPVRMEADYQELPQGMIYVRSAYFNQYLDRRIRFAYPTKMFANVHFEIDEEGRPWYVASVYDHTIGLFGGTQVIGVIIADPVSGDMQYYEVKDIPQWVDEAFPGTLICDQYNNYAQLQNGFWNSIIGQVGCRRVTEAQYSGADETDVVSDFGYIAKEGDVWIYTGVTSVNSDSSNIGFILSNERTEQTLFITCAGADEFSGMAAAEGEVQEKRYQASFPSLILVDGHPTYIMVLKDANGLVKMYAAVNVEQYNMVATATTQDDCIAKYRALMKGEISQEQATTDTTGAGTGTAAEGGLSDGSGSSTSGGAESASGSSESASGSSVSDGSGSTGAPADQMPSDTSGFEEKTITIRKMQAIDRGGNTWLYVVDSEDHIYKAQFDAVIDMLLKEEGDTVTIRTDGTYFVLP